jgi:glycosyltransferase involved in cell wall biosynthesis
MNGPATQGRLPITVVIPVKNEERNLPSCLRMLGDRFHEVVVVDSQSTDQTREVAIAGGAVVLDFQWNGRLPKKRNWTLQTYPFKSPWVLFLDADEIVTAQFLDELTTKVLSTPHAGFWVSLTNWFMGQPLYHGDTFRKLSLFRVGAGEYETFPEDRWSHLDMEVHEHPILQGTVGTIDARLEHRDYRGFAHYVSKHNEYSTWESKRFIWLQQADDSEWAKLTDRQRTKYRYLDRLWLSWLYWFMAYILKQGFRDGVGGWRFNQLKRRYFADIRLKIIEARQISADGS